MVQPSYNRVKTLAGKTKTDGNEGCHPHPEGITAGFAPTTQRKIPAPSPNYAGGLNTGFVPARQQRSFPHPPLSREAPYRVCTGHATCVPFEPRKGTSGVQERQKQNMTMFRQPYARGSPLRTLFSKPGSRFDSRDRSPLPFSSSILYSRTSPEDALRTCRISAVRTIDEKSRPQRGASDKHQHD